MVSAGSTERDGGTRSEEQCTVLAKQHNSWLLPSCLNVKGKIELPLVLQTGKVDPDELADFFLKEPTQRRRLLTRTPSEICDCQGKMKLKPWRTMKGCHLMLAGGRSGLLPRGCQCSHHLSVEIAVASSDPC